MTDIPTESLSAERDIYGCHPQRKEPDTIHVLLTRFRKCGVGLKAQAAFQNLYLSPHTKCLLLLMNEKQKKVR